MDKASTKTEWREALTPEEYRVLRKAGTERPWTGELLREHRAGSYSCRGCGQKLFRSDAKFDSQTGWPSFFEPADDGAVDLDEQGPFFFPRTEVLCAHCGSHLGHVFDDAPQTPTGLRFCMNSVALSFTPESDAAPGADRG